MAVSGMIKVNKIHEWPVKGGNLIFTQSQGDCGGTGH